MSIETLNKPQAAIDAGLYTREEAAQYLGLKAYAFDRIAKHLSGVKLGGSTYYSKFQLQAYLSKMIGNQVPTNVLHNSNTIPQSIEN